MKKFRNLVNTDFYRGNTLYNKNGKPRKLAHKRGTKNYTFEDSSVAWYTRDELMDTKNGWKVECFEDQLVELLREAVDLRLIETFSYEKHFSSFDSTRGTKIYRPHSHNKLVVELTDQDHIDLGIIDRYGLRDKQYVLSPTEIDESEFGNYCKVLTVAIYKEIDRIRDLKYDY